MTLRALRRVTAAGGRIVTALSHLPPAYTVSQERNAQSLASFGRCGRLAAGRLQSRTEQSLALSLASASRPEWRPLVHQGHRHSIHSTNKKIGLQRGF